LSGDALTKVLKKEKKVLKKSKKGVK